MKVYVWRHNKSFHSHSMIYEPCVNNQFYMDALAIVVAESREDAIAQLVAKDDGWRPEDLLAVEPKVYNLAENGAIIYTELR